MADISKVRLPESGNSYNIKDQEARDRIAALESYTDYLGVTTTEIIEGASTNPITINGESVTAKKGNIVNYGSKEFIFNGTVWQEFGDLSGLGSLAFKNSASGSYTPSGSNTGGGVTLTTSTVNSIESVGTLPSATMPTYSVQDETLIISAGSFNPGTLPTKGEDQTVATGVDTFTPPTFNGQQSTIQVS